MAKKENNKQPITFVLLDGTITTYGFRVLPEGVDLSQFKVNAPMYYNHETSELPIGTWENVRLEDGKILADAHFDFNDVREKAQEIFRKVEEGVIKMVSAGLRPLEFSDDAIYKLEGQKLPTVTKSFMREASIAAIGAIHNALRLYDNEDKEINLTDEIKLADFIKPINTDKKMNEELLKLLNLSDKADENAVLVAVKTLNQKAIDLQEKLDLKDKADKEANKAKAIELVDAAIKDGKINADAEGKTRQSYLDLFDENFERGRNILAGLPARQSVAGQIANAEQGSKTELADLLAMPWDELDKSGKLITLKDKYVDAYKDKYKERFGVEPSL